MRTLIIVFGTRPEVIKLAPLIRELGRHPDRIGLRTVLTGQHREMVAPLLRLFELTPDHDLGLMVEGQALEHITAAVLTRFTDIVSRDRPDWVVVQKTPEGDVNWIGETKGRVWDGTEQKDAASPERPRTQAAFRVTASSASRRLQP